MTEKANFTLAAEQAQAANPNRSEWVSANAGSGKTSVLTARVARLLLEGIRPSRVLCLTFTRNATGEMKNRLFETLGRWAMLENDRLVAELNGMRESDEVRFRTDESTRLDEARRLFATALEFPGGLRIQTIHAFSLTLLKRFPFEAGLDPSVDLLDERRTLQLADVAFEAAVRQAHADHGAFGNAYRKLITGATDWQMRDLRTAIIKHRIAYRDLSAQAEAAIEQAFVQMLQAPSADPIATVTDALGSAEEIEQRFTPLLHAVNAVGSDADQQQMEFVHQGIEAASRHQPLLALRQILQAFTTRSGARRKRLAVKAVVERLTAEDRLSEVEAAIDSMLDADEQRRRATVAESSIAAAHFATGYLRIYEQLMTDEAGVDYDDVVTKACNLLQRSEVRDWVRYRLDGGIDHVLVDEAQDTSPEQWEIIKGITEEFFAGRDESAAPRTVFAVGDDKQSIFSFQGAEPKLFDDTREWYHERLHRLGGSLPVRELQTSYRSAPVILKFVDQTFSRDSYLAENVEEVKIADVEAWGSPLLGWDRSPAHRAHRADEPGRVEVWDLFAEEDTPPGHGVKREHTSLDAEQSDSPKLRMAAKVADRIASWLQSQDPIQLPGTNRAISPGDIMVLVQSRTEFVSELLRLLRLKGVPTAGADRIAVRDDLAVKDLLALAEFALLPADDHSLAVVLRSPLCGISDETLYKIAYNREGSLWRSLRQQAKYDRTGELRAHVEFLRDMCDYVDHGPFEFLERALVVYNGRQKLTQRLGQDISDPIDELVSQALDFDRSDQSSLQEFVSQIQQSTTEIKTGMDMEQTRVRVMTVHAAKGLEAPIVIVPDALRMPNFAGRERIFITETDGHELPLYVRRTADDVEISRVQREDFAERERKEYYRQLYVALTRAKNWLIVGDAAGRNMRPKSWYYRVLSAAKRIGTEIDVGAESLRARVGCLYPGWIIDSTAHDGEFLRNEGAQEAAISLPEWTTESVLLEPPARRWRSPTNLVDFSDIVVNEDAEDADAHDENRFALDRGTLIHMLLERLPEVADPERRRNLAHELALSFGENLPTNEVDDVVARALQIIDHPEFGWLFAENSIPEVTFSAPVPDSRLGLQGRIDRIVVTPKVVTIVDFKSDAMPPPSPEKVGPPYLTQLGAYRGAVYEIYPKREIVTGILWTGGDEPTYMEFPNSLVDEAYRQAIAALAPADQTEEEA